MGDEYTSTTPSTNTHSYDSDLDLDLEDEHLGNWRETRIQELRAAAEIDKLINQKGRGKIVEIQESDFIAEVTAAKFAVVHFYHEDFRRCKILDQHLEKLAQSHLEAAFLKIRAERAPFFVTKLQVKVLPALLFFRDGIAVDRMIGFEDIGNSDEFKTETLENRILQSGVITMAATIGQNKPVSLMGFAGELRDHDSDDDSELD